jgi:hypothetical protein
VKTAVTAISANYINLLPWGLEALKNERKTVYIKMHDKRGVFKPRLILKTARKAGQKRRHYAPY